MGNNQPVYLTAEGKRKMEEELDYLVNVRRREVAQMIAEAKAEGDLSENAGYDEAKTQQGFLEGKIRELEVTLRLAEIIQETSNDVVGLGKTLTAIATALMLPYWNSRPDKRADSQTAACNPSSHVSNARLKA